MPQPQITSTGLRGFMQWLQRDQPVIYQATAAKIQRAAPKGFSGFNGSTVQRMRLSQGRRSMRLRGYQFGSSCCISLACVGSCAEIVAPNVCIETSCAANTGPTCASTLTGVANIISSVSNAILPYTCQSTYSCLVNTQLGRASSGLSPLNVSSSAAGVSTASTGVSSSTGLLLLAGGGLLLWAMLGRKGA